MSRPAFSVKQAAGRTDGVGFSLPTIEENDEEGGEMADLESDLVVPPHYTPAVAERHVPLLLLVSMNPLW